MSWQSHINTFDSEDINMTLNLPITSMLCQTLKRYPLEVSGLLNSFCLDTTSAAAENCTTAEVINFQRLSSSTDSVIHLLCRQLMRSSLFKGEASRVVQHSPTSRRAGCRTSVIGISGPLWSVAADVALICTNKKQKLNLRDGVKVGEPAADSMRIALKLLKLTPDLMHKTCLLTPVAAAVQLCQFLCCHCYLWRK